VIDVDKGMCLTVTNTVPRYDVQCLSNQANEF